MASRPSRSDTNLGLLLREPFRIGSAVLHERLAERGHPDVRAPHGNVFQYLDADGTRVSVLAERAQITNQSMGYLVDALEARGYVERKPDPADRRAALVVITDRGREQIIAARRQIAEIEREWEERIGSERMASLREGLEALAASLEDDAGRRAERRAAGPAASA